MENKEIQEVFGPCIQKKRIEKGFTLRKFCQKIDEDPSNWSKIEREKLNPPQNIEKLGLISKVLNLNKNDLIDLANISAGKIPKKIQNDKELMKALPAFLRTIKSVRPTPEELGEIINKIKEEA